MTKLLFMQKSVYGNILFYPVNDAAESICLVAGRKTLRLADLNRLGRAFNVDVVADTVTLKTNNKNVVTVSNQITGE